MKLRKVLFVLIVAMLVFDIALIVRHKRLPLRPPLASGAPQDSASSKAATSAPANTHPWPGSADQHCALEYDFTTHGKTYSYCLNPVDPKTGKAINFTQEDEDRILCVAKLPGACERAMHLPPRPKIEFDPEPPAPKPAGERKL